MLSGEGNDFENVVLSCLGQLACPHVMRGGHGLVPKIRNMLLTVAYKS